jgi:hypothetical protein
MEDLDKKINNLLMEEMGLEEGDRRRVYDQDSGIQYQFKGKDLVSPGAKGGKTAIEFDPINNSKMMNLMFGGFVDKLEDEESIPPVASYCTVPDGDKIRAKILFSDKSVVQSNPYKNETVCYADLVFRLNGEEDVNLDEYDFDRTKAPQSVLPPKKLKQSKPKKKGALRNEKN